MLKKVLKMLVAVSLSIVVLTGCNSTKKVDTSDSAVSATGEETKGTDTADLEKTGERYSASQWCPPRTSGTPIKPPAADKTARTINGPVIETGDSCK